MGLQRESSVVCEVPTVIERLESRGYLSASVLPANIASVPQHHSVVRVLEPAKITKATPVDLTPRITGIVHRSVNAKIITAQVVVTNAGPVTAKGSLRISIEFSIYFTGASAKAFKTINTPIKIAPGGSKTVNITGAIPKSYPAFDYHMLAIINGKKTIPETNYANDTEITRSYFYLA